MGELSIAHFDFTYRPDRIMQAKVIFVIVIVSLSNTLVNL